MMAEKEAAWYEADLGHCVRTTNQKWMFPSVAACKNYLTGIKPESYDVIMWHIVVHEQAKYAMCR
jgi:hypothetical protein